MIRRARLSFKPNVRPGGRTSGGAVRDGGEAAAAIPEEGDSSAGTPSAPNVGVPDHSAPERTENMSVSTETQPSTPASTPVQRRKRISTLPNLAKPRVSSSAAVTPSQKRPQAEAPPTLPVSSVPSLYVASPPETAKVVSPPKPQVPAAVSPHVTLPEKRTPVPHVPQFSPHKKMSLKQSEVSPIKSVECTKEEFTPLKERPPLKSSPNEELKEEKPKKLVAAGYLERERIRRAKKLRDLLRDELRKERKIWKSKHPVITNGEELERSKMTMRDFIYFIPSNNPMTSTFEEPKTPEKTLTDSQVTVPPVKNIVNDDEDDIEEEEEDENQLLAPRVKVAEDGSIILDEESLTVEVSRSKAPIVEGNDPIFERGSTTTYSSFRKNNYSKPWSDEETDMFFLAISMVGTDFSMIGQLFPHRERIEIKNKFKREERSNGWRIDKAFKEKQTFDFEFFAKRLEKALEKKQKTPRSSKPRKKKAAKPHKKQKEKAATEQILSDGESAILSDGEGDDARIEEKENEDSISVKECLPASDKVPRKKRRTRKKNELDEENPKSQDEETSQLPHKETKPRKKGKAAAQSKDSSELMNETIEDIPAADTVPEKKKKKKRKKKKLEESGSEDIGNAASSAIPDNADGNSQMNSEAEASIQLSQSEALPCEEGSSLLIFAEESGCLSGLSGLDLSSLQECLSEVPVTQSTLVVPSNTSDYDGDVYNNNDDDDDLVETCPKESSLETSPHAVNDSANQMLLETDITVDSQTEKSIKNEDATKSQDEQKTSSVEPMPLVRGRFQKPKPNISGKPLARCEKVSVTEKMTLVKAENGLPAEDTSPLSHSPKEDVAVSENLDSKGTELPPSSSRRKDDPLPAQTDCGTELAQSHAEDSHTVPQDADTAKEDIDKDRTSRLARGRLVRPKPNLKKLPVKNKPIASKPDIPTPNSQDAGQLVPCSVALSSSCLPVNEKEILVTPKTEPSASLQDDGTKSSPKSAPLLRGRFQRPKPSVMRASRKENSDDKEDSPKGCSRISDEIIPEDTNSKLSDHIQKPAGSGNHEISEHEVKHSDPSSILDNKPPPESLVFAQEVIPGNELVPTVSHGIESTTISQCDDKTSLIKPAPLARGRLQRPKPNLLKPALHKVKSEAEGENEDNMASKSTVEEPEVSPDTKDDLYKLEKAEDEDFKPTTQECPKLDSAAVQELIAETNPAETNPPAVCFVGEASSLSEAESKKPPNKPSLTRGRLQRPKPNLQKSFACTEKTGARGEEISGKKDEKTRVESEVYSDNKGHPSQLGKEVETSYAPVLFSPVMKSPTVSLDECKNSTSKSASVAHGELLGPTPNVLKQPSRKGKPGTSEERGYVASESTEVKPLPSNKNDGLDVGKSADFETEARFSEKSCLHQETCMVSAETNSTLCKELKNGVSSTEEPPKPAVQPRGRFQRPKPNMGRPLPKKDVSPAIDASIIECESEICEESTPKSKECTTHSKHYGDSPPVPANNDAQDCASPEQTRSFVLPLEAIGLASEDQTDREESKSRNKELSTSEDEKRAEPPKPALSRSRFQRPKPNLGRSLTRPALSSPQNCDLLDEKKIGENNFDTSTENNDHSGNKLKEDLSHGATELSTAGKDCSLLGSNLTPPVKATYSEEPAKGSSVKSVRSRFQKPKPNLGRLSVRKDLTPVELSPSVQEKEQLETSSTTAEKKEKESLEINTTKDAEDIIEEKPGHGTIKPALLRRGRLVRPVPNLVNPSSKKPSTTQSKIGDEEEASPAGSSGSPGSKRKSLGSLAGISIKRIRLGESEKSESDLEQSLSIKELQDSSCSTKVLEDSKQQLSRFGRPLKKPPVITPPVSYNPSENSSERPEKEKPARSVKPIKSKVAKPVSKAAKPGKTALVKLRATRQDDDDDEVEDAQADFEEEDYDLAPEKLNQAPVFVPFSLRSPKPVPAEIEETVEELEIPVEDGNAPSYIDQDLGRPHVSSVDALNNSSIEEDTQNQSLTCQDVRVSGSLLENSDSAEEATFILTLVEIPIGDDYSYSCDVNSVDALPAPVLITSGSTDVMNISQSESSEPTVMPPSHKPPSAVQDQTNLLSNPSSRKRNALSEDDCMQPSKKALVCSSAEQGEVSQPKSTGVEENNDPSLTAADIKTEETNESFESSVDNRAFSTEGQSTDESENPFISGCSDKPEAASVGSLNLNLPSAIANTASTSGTSLQRPGRKPLGFLSLVCKDKKSKANKNLCKTRCNQPSTSVLKIEEQVPEEDHEHCISCKVPSQSSSCVVESTSPTQDSDHQDTIPEESPKLHDLASEEDAAQVSQFFFGDIFMEVDD